jgi:1,1a-dihydroxy-1-hydro-9-fluorenone dehydrogenase
MSQLAGRVVVVTGAARGMGRAYVEAFAEAGARVAGLDRDWSAIHDMPPDVLQLTCDMLRPSDVGAACARVLDHFGTVDVLVNNAAMRQRDRFPPHGASTVLEASDVDWSAMLETNVVAVVRVTRCFAEPMVRQRRGSVINISSRGSVTLAAQDGVWTSVGGLERNQPYDASKAALTNLSFALAGELRPHNVAVNVVFPGATRTTGSDAMRAGRRALGQTVGALLRPEHVVPLVLHLATQDASGETGQALDAVEWNARHGHGDRAAWRA